MSGWGLVFLPPPLCPGHRPGVPLALPASSCSVSSSGTPEDIRSPDRRGRSLGSHVSPTPSWRLILPSALVSNTHPSPQPLGVRQLLSFIVVIDVFPPPPLLPAPSCFPAGLVGAPVLVRPGLFLSGSVAYLGRGLLATGVGYGG